MPSDLGMGFSMFGIDLERLFRTPGQIAVLRALWRAPTAMTGRQVQQLAGLHNLTVMQSLTNLEHLGLVRRRAAGRAYLYSLKRQHEVVRAIVDPVFQAEQALPTQFKRRLAQCLRRYCLSAVLYGSVARNQATAGSDTDLLVVVRDENAARRFTKRAQAKVEEAIRESWGSALEINLQTITEFRRQWQTPLIKQIRREGILICGVSLEELRRGRYA
jgi:predicted nucleotidyltransferase